MSDNPASISVRQSLEQLKERELLDEEPKTLSVAEIESIVREEVDKQLRVSLPLVVSSVIETYRQQTTASMATDSHSYPQAGQTVVPFPTMTTGGMGDLSFSGVGGGGNQMNSMQGHQMPPIHQPVYNQSKVANLPRGRGPVNPRSLKRPIETPKRGRCFFCDQSDHSPSDCHNLRSRMGRAEFCGRDNRCAKCFKSWGMHNLQVCATLSCSICASSDHLYGTCPNNVNTDD